MHERLIRIAALAGTIEYVHLVPLLQEQRGPAAAAVGHVEPVGALSEAAMNQHDRVGMANLGGNPMLDIHLHAVADGAASEQRVLDAVPVVGPLGDIERGAEISRSLRTELRRGERRRHQGAQFASGELLLHEAILPCLIGRVRPARSSGVRRVLAGAC